MTIQKRGRHLVLIVKLRFDIDKVLDLLRRILIILLLYL